jgi:hypothetical protein
VRVAGQRLTRREITGQKILRRASSRGSVYLNKDRRDLRKEVKAGDKTDTAKDRAEIRLDQRNINKDKRDMRHDKPGK